MAKSKNATRQAETVPAQLLQPPEWLSELLKLEAEFDKPVCQSGEESPLELVQRAIACSQISCIRAALGGFFLLAAKQKARGGSKWLDALIAENDLRVSPETLRNQMRIFELLDDLEDHDAIRAVATLHYSKVLGPLKKLGADGLRRLAHGEEVAGLTWDEACTSSRNDLQSHMRRLQADREEVIRAERRAEELAKRLDKTNAELERYRQQEIQLGKLPPSVRQARVEGGGMAMTFNEMFSHLTELANDVFQGSDLHSDHRKRQQQLTLAVNSLAIVARGAAAQAALLLQHLEEKAPGAITDSEEALPIMDRAEALAAYHRFRSMLANADYSLDTALLKNAKRKRK